MPPGRISSLSVSCITYRPCAASKAHNWFSNAPTFASLRSRTRRGSETAATASAVQSEDALSETTISKAPDGSASSQARTRPASHPPRLYVGTHTESNGVCGDAPVT